MRRKYRIALHPNKIRFLNTLTEHNKEKSMIKNYENFLYKVQSIENSMGNNREIFEYNLGEFLTFLGILGCASQESLATHLSLIKTYKEFAILEGIVPKESLAFTDNLKFSALKEFTDSQKTMTRHITETEFKDLLDMLVCYQDKALFALIFEGINGIANQDIINIKINDVDFENKIINTPLSSIPVSNELLDIIKKSQKETLYSNNNDIYTMNFELNESDYIIRPTKAYLNKPLTIADMKKNGYNGEHVLTNIISTRFYRVMSSLGDRRFEYVTINTLYNSGIISRVVKALGCDIESKAFTDYCMTYEGTSQSIAYKLYHVYKDVISVKLEVESGHTEKKIV